MNKECSDSESSPGNELLIIHDRKVDISEDESTDTDTDKETEGHGDISEHGEDGIDLQGTELGRLFLKF